MKLLLGIIWSALAIILIGLAIWYVALEAMLAYGGAAGSAQLSPAIPVFLQLPLIILILALLFIVEGAEIAVAGLLDKDPEQLPEKRGALRDLLAGLRVDPEVFFSGRQLLVVTAIVALTYLASVLSTINRPPIADHDWKTRLLWLPASPGVSAFFAFSLPIFIVLWFAQLLPKFLAQENPLGALAPQFTQMLVKLSTLFGGTFEIGRPSVWMKQRLRAKHVGEAAEELGPSREAHYKSSAILRYGRGLESCYKRIEIGATGEVKSLSRLCYKAFKNNFNREYGFMEWWAATIKDVDHKILQTPKECGAVASSGATLSDMMLPGGASVTKGKVELRLNLPLSLPMGRLFEYEIECATYNAAMSHKAGDEDSYSYVVTVPTKKLTFEIIPADNAGFLMMDGRCDVVLSKDTGANQDEAKRVTITAGPHQRGYHFEAEYVLEGTEITFRWKLGTPAPH